MPSWITDNQTMLIWVAGTSLVLFIATLFATPWILLRIPPDYFTHPRRPPGIGSTRGRGLRWTIRILKNIVAAGCIVAGLFMLILPGQGLLTILVGMILIEFPGKYTLEKRLIARPKVIKALNRFRTKRGEEPLANPSETVEARP